MNKLLTTITALLLGFSTATVLAKQAQQAAPLDWYDVEVIVFSHHDLSALSQETWKRDPGTPDIRDARELLPPLPANLSAAHSDKLKQPLAFLQLRDDQYVMDDKYQALLDATGYEPMIHLAWRQPGLGPDDAVAVHIHGGVNGTLQADVSKAGETDSEQQVAINSDMMGPPAPYIDGTIKLIRQRFLHVDVDLLYRAPYVDSPVNPLSREQWPQAFRLTESRRMRSREVHYLDHPMFGVLIIATPYEPPEPTTEAANASRSSTSQQSQSSGKQNPLSGTIRR